MASVSGGVVEDAAASALLLCGRRWRLWRAGGKNPNKHFPCAFRGMGLGELGNSRVGFIRGLGGLCRWGLVGPPALGERDGNSIGGNKQVARGPGWEWEWGFSSGEGRGSDGRGRECA